MCSRNLAGNNGGNDDSFGSLVSADGSKAVFFSYASDLVAGDTNDAGDLFAFDIASRTLQVVDKNMNGVPGNGEAFQQAVSADGRYVAFHSYATDLVPGDFSRDSGSVFRRDLQAGTTVLVSQNRALSGEGNASSYSPQISADGAVISFISSASDLISGDANVADDIFTWTTGVSGIDLAITMTAFAGSVAQGGALSYTITVTNYGLVTATGVVVNDALPAALTFVSATASQGAFTNSGGLFSCNVGNLSVAGGVRITINSTANTAGYVTNSATTGASQTDFNPANNTASAVVLVAGTAPPTLSVTVTNGSRLFLNWPYPSSGYNLETATNLAPSVWSPVTHSISNNGLINFLLLNVNPVERTRFHRLHHP